MRESLNTLNMSIEEWHILKGLNINLYEKGALLKLLFKQKIYLGFSKTFGFKQIVQSTIRATNNSSSLINNKLINAYEKIAQCGLIGAGLSDHAVILCKRKLRKSETMWSIDLQKVFDTIDQHLLKQHKVLHRINKDLSKNFCNICDWFTDNKLSIHLRYEIKLNLSLVIKYDGINIKQYSKVTYLGCKLDENLPTDSYDFGGY